LLKDRAGKENLTQAFSYSLYFVTTWTRQPVIGPPFPTNLVFSGMGAWPLAPLWRRHWMQAVYTSPNFPLFRRFFVQWWDVCDRLVTETGKGRKTKTAASCDDVLGKVIYVWNQTIYTTGITI